MSKTIRLLSVLIILIFTSCATGNSLTNDTPSDFDSNYDDTTPPTTSSTFGNPALQINLEGSVYLTLNEDQDNMRQIIDAELKTVIDYEDPELAVKTLSVSATPEQDIPAVKNFYLGNHDDLVFVFFDAMEWNDESCLLIHAQNDIVTCLEDSSFELSSDIQFDGAGNVFYFGKSLDTETLIKRDSSSFSKTHLTNQNINLIQWFVHENGTVYMVGEVDGTNFFRSISTNNELKNILPGDAQVAQFNFLNANTIIFQGSNVPYADITTSGNFLLDLHSLKIVEQLDFPYGNLETMQLDSDKNAYVQYEDEIYHIYPDIGYSIDTELAEINLFKVFENTLYIAGQNDLTQQLLAIDLASKDFDSEIILHDHEVYHLISYGDFLYFDGLNFENNTIYVGAFDKTTFALTEIEEVFDGLVQLETIALPANYSFGDSDSFTYSHYSSSVKRKVHTLHGEANNSINNDSYFTNEYYILDDNNELITRINYLNEQLNLISIESTSLINNCWSTDTALIINEHTIYPGCSNNLQVSSSPKAHQDFWGANLTLINLTSKNIMSFNLVSKHNKTVAVLGTNNITFNESLQDPIIYIYKYENSSPHIEASMTVPQAKKSWSDQDGFVYIIYSDHTIRKYNSSLELIDETNVYNQDGEISIIGKVNDTLVIKIENELETDKYKTKLLVLNDTEDGLYHLHSFTLNEQFAGAKIEKLNDTLFNIYGYNKDSILRVRFRANNE